MNNRITQFTDKYKKSGFMGQILLKKFFAKIQSILPNEISSVAEIGCGAGYSTKELVNFFDSGVSFFASDVDPELVKLAREKTSNVEFGTESIYQLEHDNSSFDLVFCLEVLEHLESPDEALAELERITKKYVVVSVPNEPLWRMLNMARFTYLKDFGNTPGHLNHWSKKKMVDFVSRKFDVIKATSSLPWIIILAKKK
ncbi:class I SAM-dependent methyltransferase [Candidatus Nomurabacteria bacterium]|nr:class I SAM-dependent methyltransferase [Candidatus Nomurabacteria bacterium]